MRALEKAGGGSRLVAALSRLRWTRLQELSDQVQCKAELIYIVRALAVVPLRQRHGSRIGVSHGIAAR
jgi:hypothetical protein